MNFLDECELTKNLANPEYSHSNTAVPVTGWQDVLLNLPVGVNNQSGDPFQSNQIKNTLEKLRSLEDSKHRGPIGLLTKSCIPGKLLYHLKSLNLDIFLFFSITGLRESKVCSQEQILQSYIDACRMFPAGRVATVIRPIIPGKNDSIEVLRPILETAREGQKILVARGYRDTTWRLIENHDFMNSLGHESGEMGLRVFRRTACLVAAMQGTACILHKNKRSNQAGLSLAVELGYGAAPRHENGYDVIALDSGCEHLTVGDVHFVQILTGVKVIYKTPESGNILGFLRTRDNIPIDCSSSWFSYARTTSCQIKCFYCEDAYNSHSWGEIGCVPIHIYDNLEFKRR
ncbi:MAG: hypothetical protein LBB68_02645 [Treponema sp.]|jgi:hypothetical protein|nr:hypothetical protein [Treponema sp.]